MEVELKKTGQTRKLLERMAKKRSDWRFSVNGLCFPASQKDIRKHQTRVAVASFF